MRVSSPFLKVIQIVRHVGHVPELYEDARSEKYKKYKIYCKSVVDRSTDVVEKLEILIQGPY